MADDNSADKPKPDASSHDASRPEAARPGVPPAAYLPVAPPPDIVYPKPDNIVAALLKAPHLLAPAIAEGKNPLGAGIVFLACALAAHAVFGLAVGLFGGWPVAFMDVVKAPLIGLCALMICLPSLYVFACVGGAPLTVAQAFMLGSSCLAMIGLLLVGLAPVAWLFAVSTDSEQFIVLLALGLWFIGTAFALRYIMRLEVHALFRRSQGIKAWFLVFILVTLQMTTCLRPILDAPDKGWWTTDKKFFLTHFFAVFQVDGAASEIRPLRSR